MVRDSVVAKAPLTRFHSSNLFSGLSPHIFPDAFESELNHQAIHCPADPFTDCIQKVESISSRALTTLMQTKHEEDNVSGKPGPLHAIIRLFDEEILKIKRESQGLLGKSALSLHNKRVAVAENPASRYMVQLDSFAI
jgi:hypothetical protein